MTRLMENYLPPVNEDGIVTNKNVTFGGNLAVTGNSTVTGNQTVSGNQTVTGNLTISGSSLGGKMNVVDAITTTALTVAQSGSLVLWDAAAGFTITLPTPAIGLNYTLAVATSVTSSNHKLITSAGTVFLYGGLAMGEASGVTTLEALGDGSTHVAVTMNGTTSGGLIGTCFQVVCTSATKWLVSGLVAGSGSLATPFATS